MVSHPSGLDPEGLFTGGGGGGHFKPKLEPRGASRERGESMSGGGGSLEGGPRELPRNFLKIYVSENALQAILKPSFPYYITSI